MRYRSLALVLSLAGAYPLAYASAQTGSHSVSSKTEVAQCRDVRLARKPGWTISAAFTADGSQLRVVDPLYRTILRYKESGESLGPVEDPLKRIVQNVRPVAGRARGQQFILEGDEGLMLMDKDLRPMSTKSIPVDPKGLSVTALWEWEPVGKADIVGFADIGYGTDPTVESKARTAFVRFPIQNPGQVQILGKPFPVTGTQNKGYYRSTYTYITSLGEAAYYLSFNDGLKLYRQEGQNAPEDKSALLPKGLSKALLTDWNSRQEFTNMMKDIEGWSMPVGLFGWRGSGRDWLFLLYRTPQGGGTQWTMYRIDPSGRLPWSAAEIPVHANHVTVAPGVKSWAFIEKGPVLAYGVQDAPRILFVSSALLTSASPLRIDSKICN